MAKTKIAWATESWNPVRYLDGWMCTKVSPGCLHCYAERMNLRFGNGLNYDSAPLSLDGWRLDEKVLNLPFHWRKPRRVFVQSMGDLFHEQISIAFLTHIFDTIEECPQHTFLILTKRPENIKRLWTNQSDDPACSWRYMREGTILPNVWLGVTVESEKYLHRVNALNEIAAAVKFVSLEPLLEEIHIESYLKYLNQVIVGPETGPHRRPCKPEWIENIIEQCDAAKVPVFVKAFPFGNRISHDPAEWPEWARRREYPK